MTLLVLLTFIVLLKKLFFYIQKAESCNSLNKKKY